MNRGARAAAAFGVYAAASILLFGRGVVAAPHTRVVGDAGADKTIFLWSFVWWPHALGHGHDPFHANVVWVPHGIDLAWATSAPLASLVAFPLTALVGPVAAYNVLVLAAPALSAWAAYLLAHWLTKSFWPSLVAGWLFGFSAFEIGHLVGHLNLVLLPFVPLCALLILRHLHGELSTRRFVAWTALALVGQFLLSTELFVTIVLVGVVFAVCAFLLDRALRPSLIRTVQAAAGAIALCLAVVSPYLWHAFVDSSVADAPARSPYSESADVLNYVVPTRRLWIQFPGSAHVANTFRATPAERGAYIGVALVAIVAAFAWRARFSRRRAAVLVGLAVVVVLSLGSRVRVAGHALTWTPWRYLARLPVLKTVLPIRLTLFVALVVAVVVAVWLAEAAGRSRSRWRWVLALVGVILVVPNPASSRWTAAVPNPRFFRGDDARAWLRPGDVAIVLPFGGAGWSLYWQAEDALRYRLVGGHLGRRVTRAEAQWRAVYDALGPGPTPVTLVPLFRRFLVAHRVDAIIVATGTPWRVRRLVDRLQVVPRRVGDVLVYRLAPADGTRSVHRNVAPASPLAAVLGSARRFP